MQSFKFATEEIDQFLKKSKQERQQNLKKIKVLYKELQQKEDNSYDQALERIGKNLHFFKQSKYSEVKEGLDLSEMVHEFQEKMGQLESQISKMNKIIEKGCGEIVKKESIGQEG